MHEADEEAEMFLSGFRYEPLDREGRRDLNESTEIGLVKVLN